MCACLCDFDLGSGCTLCLPLSRGVKCGSCFKFNNCFDINVNVSRSIKVISCMLSEPEQQKKKLKGQTNKKLLNAFFTVIFLNCRALKKL